MPYNSGVAGVLFAKQATAVVVVTSKQAKHLLCSFAAAAASRILVSVRFHNGESELNRHSHIFGKNRRSLVPVGYSTIDVPVLVLYHVYRRIY